MLAEALDVSLSVQKAFTACSQHVCHLGPSWLCFQSFMQASSHSFYIIQNLQSECFPSMPTLGMMMPKALPIHFPNFVSNSTL